MMPLSLIDFEISSASGPELPMQVVQPKPTRLNPTLSRSSCSPELERYSATTWLPGASDVLTQGFAVRPRAAALRAKSPAPISTLGLEVLVHDVIAAAKPSATAGSATRPSGRFGPAIEGTTSPRSSVSVSVNTGSGDLAVRNRPCALA